MVWPLIVGIIFLALGEAFLGPWPAWQTILCTLGSVLVTTALVGTVLSARWWRAWSVNAFLEIFSKRELIESLNLSREEIKRRFFQMIGAAFGANLPGPLFKSAYERDVLEKLAFPVRRNFKVFFDLHREKVTLPDAGYGTSRYVELARLYVHVSYTLHNYSRETAQPFADRLVMKGFVDVPETLVKEWRASLERQGLKPQEERAEQELARIAKQAKIFAVEYLSIGDRQLEEGKHFGCKWQCNGTRPEPDVHYEVKLVDESSDIKVESDSQINFVLVFSSLHNLMGYDFRLMNQLTEELVARFTWDEFFEGVLRYLLPPYWKRELREIIPGARSRTLYVRTMLFPGHGIFVSWRPAAFGDSDLSRPSDVTSSPAEEDVHLENGTAIEYSNSAEGEKEG
ncbi:hypothetical protein H5T53_04800 [Candidatus Bipolaricaulota bacterium]|nr:hypothetical protein [Candidatus Bipolaricaulota bacterium]